MNKKIEEFDENEWKKFLEEEYIEEADKLEDALFADEEFAEPEISDAEVKSSYERLMECIHAEEAVKKVVHMPEAKTKKTKSRLYHFARTACITLIVLGSLFAASMSIEANRNYFIKRVRYIVGDRSNVVIENDETNDWSGDEKAARNEIEEKLYVEIPEFMYAPEGWAFYSHWISEADRIAILWYHYKDAVVTMEICKQNDARTSANLNLEEKIVASVDNDVADEAINIVEVPGQKDGMNEYFAEWTRDDNHYQITARMDSDIFIKIIEQMRI